MAEATSTLPLTEILKRRLTISHFFSVFYYSAGNIGFPATPALGSLRCPVGSLQCYATPVGAADVDIRVGDRAGDKPFIRFGRFLLDPVRCRLMLDGQPVSLQPLQFDTLLYLAENAQRVVDKDELLSTVWRGRVVEEGSLTQTVFLLRRALRAGGGEAYIVTAPGRGYRFAVEVARAADLSLGMQIAPTTATEAPAARALVQRIRRWSLARQIFATGAILVVVAGVLLISVRRPGQTSRPALPVRADVFGPPQHSVAVMPFANLTGDAGQEYFADGLSEEIIDALGRAPEIRIAARLSAFSLKGARMTVGEIGRKLNVGAVLEGAVRGTGKQLRITTQLVDTETGYQIWSRSYDRTETSALGLQAEIASEVLKSLKVTLLADETGRLGAGGTRNATALDAFLRGIQEMHRPEQVSYEKALAAFDEAVRIDPSYAEAEAARAHALLFVAVMGTSMTLAQINATVARALADVDTAISHAPGLAMAHSTRSLILICMLDFSAAEAEIARAMELAPGSATIQMHYAFLESQLGHDPAAEAAALRSVALDPLAPTQYAFLAKVQSRGRHFEDALSSVQHEIALDPKAQETDAFWRLHYALGKPELALQDCPAHHAWWENVCMAIVEHALSNQTEAKAALDRLRIQFVDEAPYTYAEIYAQWGERDTAMRLIEAAITNHDTDLPELGTDQLLDPLRNIPRFKAIERELGFRNDG